MTILAFLCLLLNTDKNIVERKDREKGDRQIRLDVLTGIQADNMERRERKGGEMKGREGKGQIDKIYKHIYVDTKIGATERQMHRQQERAIGIDRLTRDIMTNRKISLIRANILLVPDVSLEVVDRFGHKVTIITLELK